MSAGPIIYRCVFCGPVTGEVCRQCAYYFGESRVEVTARDPMRIRAIPQAPKTVIVREPIRMPRIREMERDARAYARASERRIRIIEVTR